MIVGLLLNLAGVSFARVTAWLAAQSTLTLLLLAGASLVVAYVALALYAATRLPTTFCDHASIRLLASREKVFEHILDFQKNPLAARQCVRTTLVSPDVWHEEIGDQEVITCRTTQSEFPKKLVRECHAPAVSATAKLVFLLERPEEDETSTMLRIFVTIDTGASSSFSSVMTPMVRLLLHYRPSIIQQVTKEYLECLCRDLGVPYEPLEAF